MSCPRCHAEVASAARFCTACGAEQPGVPAGAGALLNPPAQFVAPMIPPEQSGPPGHTGSLGVLPEPASDPRFGTPGPYGPTPGGDIGSAPPPVGPASIPPPPAPLPSPASTRRSRTPWLIAGAAIAAMAVVAAVIAVVVVNAGGEDDLSTAAAADSHRQVRRLLRTDGLDSADLTTCPLGDGGDLAPPAEFEAIEFGTNTLVPTAGDTSSEVGIFVQCQVGALSDETTWGYAVWDGIEPDRYDRVLDEFYADATRVDADAPVEFRGGEFRHVCVEFDDGESCFVDWVNSDVIVTVWSQNPRIAADEVIDWAKRVVPAVLETYGAAEINNDLFA